MTDQPSAETFEALEADVMARFAEADYDGALALLDAHASRFPANRANETYLRACLAVRRDDQDAAIAILRAALDEGLWYSDPILRQSPSLQPLQGEPSYEAVVAAYAERAPREARATEPEIRRPAGDPRGLLVAFHGNGQSARHAADAWSSLLDDGWVVAAPLSSQMLHSAGAVWDDVTSAQADVRRQAAAVGALAGPGMPVVIAGFSLGADVGLWAALAGIVPTKRTLLIGPPAFLPGDPAWPELLAGAGDLRAKVLLGSADVAVAADAVRAMVDALRAAGASVDLELLEGLAHVYPGVELRRKAVETLARGDADD